MITITDDNFETEVLNSDKIILIDCYADWCGPCKALKPLLVQMVEDSDGAELGLLDIEANPKLAAKLQVTTIPKVVVFKAGEQITAILGVRQKSDYQDVIDGLSDAQD